MHWGGVTVAVGAATVTLFTFSPSWAGRALDQVEQFKRDFKLMKKQISDCFEL